MITVKTNPLKSDLKIDNSIFQSINLRNYSKRRLISDQSLNLAPKNTKLSDLQNITKITKKESNSMSQNSKLTMGKKVK